MNFKLTVPRLRAGRAGFEMLHIRVDAVIAAEKGVTVKSGNVIDPYISNDVRSGPNQVVAFAERYVPASEGLWSEADKAFMVARASKNRSDPATT
jgi:hypothetical protein